MITLANIRRSVYNLFKRVEGIEEFLFQFITDWSDFKEEGIVANQIFPETWHKTGVLNNLIQDINADDTATTGKVYAATVSFNDLPLNMLQAKLKIEIKEDSGKVILFTLINNEISPYYWWGISSYSGEVVWKSFLTEHQDISGKANIADLATVATSGDYNDLINKPSALDGKSAYELAVDNGFEGTEQEWLTSLKGPQGIQGIQGIQGPAGQDGADGADGQDGAPGQDGHSPVVTASKSGSTTTIYVDGASIATIEDGLDGQDAVSPTLATVATSGSYNDLSNKPSIPSKTSDLTNDSNFIDGLVILSYGSSTWNDFINAYNKNKVVYCRASSNANPAAGSQTRLAFMAFVSNATSPANVEFQYYRSVLSHTDNQQGDQVFVYKLTNANVWSVEVREAYTKVVAGTGLSSSYSNGAITLTNSVSAQVQSDWNASSGMGLILNKPTLATVATSGSYNDLSDKPTIPTVPTNVSSFTNDAGYLTSHLSLTNYVQKSQTSGLLKNDGTVDTNTYLTSHLDISGKANSADLATVATSGSYNDLSNKPIIPSKITDLQDDSNFLQHVSQDLYVDMGLPSGTLWAKKNIDVTQADGFAASEYQYLCSFFSWGNTDGHNPTITSAFAPYSFGASNSGEPYASSEGAKISYPGSAGLSHDAARVNLGGPWREPTTLDFLELFDSNYTKFIDANGNDIADNVTDKLVTVNSIIGIRLKSKVNGNIIFFPCAGYGSGASLGSRGSAGYYWSSSLNSATGGRYLNFYSGGVNPQNSGNRFYGYAVRSVIDANSILSSVAFSGSYSDLTNKPTIPTVPSNQSAVSGGTTLSVVTTGEKYTWNNKANIWRGTQSQYNALSSYDNNTIYIIS